MQIHKHMKSHLKCKIIFVFILSLAFKPGLLSAQEDEVGAFSLQGTDGVYIGISYGVEISGQKATRIVIERRIGGRGRWQKAGESNGALNPQEFRNTLGNEHLLWLWKDYLNLNSETQFWEFVNKNPEPENFELAALQTPLIIALGYMIADKGLSNTRPGTTVNYKALFYNSQGSQLKEFVWNHVIINKETFEKPLAFIKSESDSVITISWKSGLRDENWPTWAKAYRTEATSGRTELLPDRIIAQVSETEDSIYYFLSDSPLPGYLYRYHIIPENIVGLPGVASDTVSAISRHISSVMGITDLTAKDTLGGVRLSWSNPERDPMVAGIIIERARTPEGPYHQLDTIGVEQSNYMDYALLPAVTYYYRLRWMGIRLETMPHMAWVTHTFYHRSAIVLPPANLRAFAEKEFITLVWDKADDLNVVGYYVQRRPDYEEEWETISPLLERPEYTDTNHRLAGSIVYAYSVVALSINDNLSIPSAQVFIRPEKPVTLPAPEGLVIASGPGQNQLRWMDMQARVINMSHYNVYRKQGRDDLRERPGIQAADLARLGFEQVTRIQNNTTYTDPDLPPGQFYAYALTIADSYGNESPPAFTVGGGYEILLSPPAWFGVRRLPDGIEISWDKSLEKMASEVVVMRRTSNQRQAVEVRTVPVSAGKFTDTPSAGTLYFYSIKLKKNNLASEPSLEKSIRR
jgi:hypothetical protein